MTPAIARVTRGDPAASLGLAFPLLLRAPGFHAGRHFVRVERQQDLKQALATLPGDDHLAIEPLAARGVDGQFRKYRVMSIGDALYPLHVAISTDWKVHYATSGMATDAAHRAEEARFLHDMPGVLGPQAMTALTRIARTLGLDYAGIDFALGPDGAVLLFEANATMGIHPPDPNPIWDDRRAPVARALAAAQAMLLAKSTGSA